jgi:hypothetical protein
MKPAGLKTTKPRNSTDLRSGRSLSVAPNEFRSTLVGAGSISPYLEEERNADAHEDNGFKDPAKPRVSNRQLSVDSGTLLELLDYPTTSP